MDLIATICLSGLMFVVSIAMLCCAAYIVVVTIDIIKDFSKNK